MSKEEFGAFLTSHPLLVKGWLFLMVGAAIMGG